MTRGDKRYSRRAALALGALSLLFGPSIASGCAGGFTPISKIDSLRVLGVTVDQSYAAPGETVTFEMTFHDGYVDPKDPEAGPRNVQIVWLGGCFNPAGDAYYECYSQLATVFQGLSPDGPPPSGLVGFGPLFSITMPGDIVASRPKPPTGPHYGIAYVFFAACAGTLEVVPPDSSGNAGAFPLGCFDADGNRLGAESFVPGYTQVYAFDDGRRNTNPAVKAMTLDGKPLSEDFTLAPAVKRCTVPEDDRLGPPACGKEDPFTACEAYDLDIDVEAAVADVDPDGKTEDGKPLREVVWVDYFADQGDFDADVSLVNDATTGLVDKHKVRWIAPREKGLVSLWAVLHDSRGGSTVLPRYVRVE
jgi:hypothetical protein